MGWPSLLSWTQLGAVWTLKWMVESLIEFASRLILMTSLASQISSVLIAVVLDSVGTLQAEQQTTIL